MFDRLNKMDSVYLIYLQVWSLLSLIARVLDYPNLSKKFN